MSTSKDIKYKELNWEDIDPYKFEFSTKKQSKTKIGNIPYEYIEIYYVENGVKYLISFNDIPIKIVNSLEFNISQ